MCPVTIDLFHVQSGNPLLRNISRTGWLVEGVWNIEYDKDDYGTVSEIWPEADKGFI